MRTIRLLALCCAASPLLSCTGSTEPAESVAAAGVAGELVRATPTVAIDLGPRATGGDGCPQEPSFGYEYAWSTALDVNVDGVVVGETNCVALEDLVFRWTAATGMEQLSNYPGGYRIDGGWINKQGNIAATFDEWWSGNPSPIIWTAANTRINLAAGRLGYARDINDRNEVVGVIRTETGLLPFFWNATSHLVVLRALGTKAPAAVNRQGDVVAASADGVAILSKTGAIIRFTGLDPQDMNHRRQVVGATGAWPTPIAAIWSPWTGIRKLGTLGGAMSYAYGINSAGEVVGASTTTNGEVHAFYWTPSRGLVDLGRGEAYAISDKGHVVGTSPTGLIHPWGGEVWHATMWRGTGGVAPSAMTTGVAGAPSVRTARCINDPASWRTKSGMFRCLSARP